MSQAPWPRLRPATNRDAEPIKELVFTVLGEYGLDPDLGQTDADLDDIEGSYHARGGVFYVLETQAGEIIGAYGLYPMETGACELRKMYLRADQRGQGLGKRLMDQALEIARQLGFKQVVLETASVLREAIALYEKYGFRPHHSDHLSARCDQAYTLTL